MGFDAPGNLARVLVYFPPGIRAWTAFMPGAFATYPVHNPDLRAIRSGHRLDPITRSLFRHSSDGRGLRSRAYAMAWAVHRRHEGTDRPLRWLSLAAGTGHQSLEAVRLLRHPADLLLTDIDQDVLDFATELAEGEAATVRTCRLDALDGARLSSFIRQMSPDVIEAMGLVEYLDDDDLVSLVRVIAASAPKGCQVVFTNMRPTHPGLEIHRRGLGWPGVIVRTEDEVCAALQEAGIAQKDIQVILPDDFVYGVYEFYV